MGAASAQAAARRRPSMPGLSVSSAAAVASAQERVAVCSRFSRALISVSGTTVGSVSRIRKNIRASDDDER